jgi:predicted phosphodiesterase
MTRCVAALYDIHGNLPALEAVLDDVRSAGVDQIVVGGDVVPGPMPRETLACLRALEIPTQFIHGNCEVAALAELAGRSSGVPEPFRSLVQWSGEQLDEDQRDALAAWPRTIAIDIEGLGAVLFCHGTPRDENEIFTRVTPDERILPAFTGVTSSLVVGGHTHMQFDRTIGNLRVVNAGSVGMPFGDPGAYWLLLGPRVDFRHTSYDLDAAAARIRASAYPQAEQFAANELLHPRSEEEMLQLFEPAAR